MAMSVPRNQRQLRTSEGRSIGRTSLSLAATSTTQPRFNTSDAPADMSSYSSQESGTSLPSARRSTGRKLSTKCRGIIARFDQQKACDPVRIEGKCALSQVLLNSAHRASCVEDRIVRDPNDDDIDYAAEARTSWSMASNHKSKLEVISASTACADFSDTSFVRSSCTGMHSRVPGEPGPPSGWGLRSAPASWRLQARDSWLKSAPMSRWGKSIIDRTVADNHPAQASPTPKHSEGDETIDLHELLDQTGAEGGFRPEKKLH